MCYILTVGLPDSGDKAHYPFRYGGFCVKGSENLSVSSIFPEGFCLYEITFGGCSCDIYPTSPAAPEIERMRRKMMKKGWSENKINRAIDGKAKDMKIGMNSVQKNFITAVSNATRQSGQVALLVHNYTGDKNKEVVRSLGANTVGIQQFMESGAMFPEDTLIMLTQGENHSKDVEPDGST